MNLSPIPVLIGPYLSGALGYSPSAAFLKRIILFFEDYCHNFGKKRSGSGHIGSLCAQKEQLEQTGMLWGEETLSVNRENSMVD